MATHLLDPDSDHVIDWSATAGSALRYDRLDEAVREPDLPSFTGDYCFSNTLNQELEVGFGTVTLDSETVTEVKLHVGTREFSNTVLYRLLTGTTELATLSSSENTNDWEQVTYTGSLTQGQLDDLRAEAVVTAQSGANAARFVAAYIEVTTEASGGATLTQDVNDTVGAADARAFSRGLLLADTPTVADARAFSREMLLADATSVADARTFDRQIVVADAATVADDITTGAGLNLTEEIDDTVGTTDARAFARGMVLADTAALTDARAFGRDVHVADAVGAADEASTTRGIVQAIADAVSAADARSFLAAFVRTITDAVGLTDARVFGGTAEQGEEQDLTLAPISKGSLSPIEASGSELEPGVPNPPDLTLDPVTKGTLSAN